MFSEAQVRQFAPVVMDLELEEPILAAWRYHEGEASCRGWRHHLSKIRTFVRKGFCSIASHLPSPSSWVVLFPLSNTPATSGTILPIFKELKRTGESPFLVTRRYTTSLIEQAENSRTVPLETLMALAPLSGRREIQTKAETYAENLAGRIPVSDIRRTANWIASGLLLREVIPSWIEGARALVMDSDITGFQKGFILGARRANVPTFILQHGFFGEHQFPTSADYLLTWGEYFSSIARDRFDFPAERLISAGCPRWDHLSLLREKSRDERILKRLGATKGTPLVLILSNAHGAKGYPEHYSSFFHSLKRLIEAGIPVAVKLHPNEADLQPYSEFLGPELTAKIRTVPPDIDLYEAIRHCDVVFQVFTAAVMEAMLIAVPVLYEGGGNDAGILTDIPDNGGGVWSKPDTIVEDVMSLAIHGERRNEVLEQQEKFLKSAFANRGKAAKSISKVITEGGYNVC